MRRTFPRGEAGQGVRPHVGWEQKPDNARVFIRMPRVAGRLAMVLRFKLITADQTVQVWSS
jgi:hypothetical protein